jgi:DNA-binding transcriptional MocR family regulator
VDAISFARGAPSPDLIPARTLAECAAAAAEREGAGVFGYGVAGGYGPLREWVAERHGVAAGRVVLTVGGLLGFVLYTAAQLERRPGRVLVEGPSYDRTLKIVAGTGAELVPLQMDEEGLDPDALEAELRARAEPASFLYTIPTFQNPSGRTLSADRRRRIAEIAGEHGLPVLEDDPYGLVRFEGQAQPTLHSLEGGRLVTYASSFSKTVAPGLRTGYFVLPEGEVAGLEERAASAYIAPPAFPQATIAEFIARGHFEPNLDTVRAGLRARRDAMVGELERSLGGRASWSQPEGGYFLWLDLGAGAETAELLGRAQAEGVAFVRGSDFFPNGSGLGAGTARLAFSFESPERIARGVQILAALVAS